MTNWRFGPTDTEGSLWERDNASGRWRTQQAADGYVHMMDIAVSRGTVFLAYNEGDKPQVDVAERHGSWDDDNPDQRRPAHPGGRHRRQRQGHRALPHLIGTHPATPELTGPHPARRGVPIEENPEWTLDEVGHWRAADGHAALLRVLHRGHWVGSLSFISGRWEAMFGSPLSVEVNLGFFDDRATAVEVIRARYARQDSSASPWHDPAGRLDQRARWDGPPPGEPQDHPRAEQTGDPAMHQPDNCPSFTLSSRPVRPGDER